MAIFNRNNFPNGLRSGFSFEDNGETRFRINQYTAEHLTEAVGYVYVFDKDKFTFRNSSEALTYEIVEPVRIIEVTEKDLPRNIEVKEF